MKYPIIYYFYPYGRAENIESEINTKGHKVIKNVKTNRWVLWDGEAGRRIRRQYALRCMHDNITEEEKIELEKDSSRVSIIYWKKERVY